MTPKTQKTRKTEKPVKPKNPESKRNEKSFDFCPQCCLTFIRLTYFFSRVMKRAFAAASVARDGNACTCSKRKQAYTRKGAFPPHFFGAKFAKNLQGTKRGRRRQSRRCKWTLSAELDNINQTRPGKTRGFLEMNFISYFWRQYSESYQRKIKRDFLLFVYDYFI